VKSSNLTQLSIYYISRICEVVNISLHFERGCTQISSATFLKEVLDEEVIPRKGGEGGEGGEGRRQGSHFELAKISRWFIARRELRIIKSEIKTWRHTQFN
jgi:hypothetical protein